MKRSNTILIVILFVLAAGYFIYTQTRPVQDNIFHVEDTSQIHRIELTKVIKGEEREQISLARSGEEWLVNDVHTAVDKKIEAFLNTLGGIRVRDNIEDAGQETALSILKKNHTLVKVLDADEDELVAYLVGPTDSKHKSNIMMVDGASRAYYVSKPGLDGYVSVQYQLDPLLWREKLLWNLEGSDLAEVKVDYLSYPEENFTLQREGEGTWTLIEEGGLANPKRVEDYLRLFTGKIFAESFADLNFPGMRDSLSRRTPDVRFQYRSRSSETPVAIRLFARPENQNNYFGYLENQQELYTVQHFVMDKYLKRKTYFSSGI